jgi:hypothetical protein
LGWRKVVAAVSQKKIECLCVVGAEGRTYPVKPAAPGDARFTREMVREVGAVLAAYGFPPIEDGDADFYALMWVLVRFCWGAPCGTAGRTVLR